MNNTEDYNLKNKNTDVTSSDASLELLNVRQSDSLDTDELQQLLGESFVHEANDSSATIINENELSSPADENEASALEELEELYGVTLEAQSDATEPALSALDELEALCGDSAEIETVDMDTLSLAEDPTSEEVSDTASLLEEIEALYGDSVAAETKMAEPTEPYGIEPSMQASALTSTEDDIGNLSALDELRAFLGETASAEAATSDPAASNLGDSELSTLTAIEDYSVSRRSVFDELQNLLLSCIDELKTETKTDSSNTDTSNTDSSNTDSSNSDVVYPERAELQSLLETILGKLLLISDNTETDEIISSDWIADELDKLMIKTVDEEDPAEPLTSSEAYESSVLDGLEMLLGESGLSDVTAAYDDPVADNMEQGSALDEFDSYMTELSEGTDVAEQEAAYDDPVADNMEQGSAPDEFDSYMAELSEGTDVDEQEVAEEKTAVNAVAVDPVAASDTLADLEAMLDEINVSANANGNDIGSEEVNAGEEESYEEEPCEEAENLLSPDDYKQAEYEADSEPYCKGPSVETETDIAEADSVAIDKSEEDSAGINVVLLNEPDKSYRLPVTGLLFSAMIAVAVYGVWNWLDNADETGSRSQAVKTRQLKQTPYDPEHNTGQALAVQELVVQERTEKTSLAATESIYQPQTKTVASDTVEPGFVEMGEYKPESVNTELVDNTDIVSDVAQEPQLEDAQIIPDDQAEQPDDLKMADLQAAGLQAKNRENIETLNKRMIEAEETIASLQVENNLTANIAVNTNAHVDVEPVTTVQSDQAIVPTSPASQQIIDWSEHEVPADKAPGKAKLWSVHLASYYGKPPSASELEHLANAGISYEIKKAIINDGVWYRVVVNEFSDYVAARKYFEQIRQKSVRKDIWINRSQ